MAESPYFSSDFYRFLRELGRHNERPWFEAHRDWYVRAVQAPAVRFVREVGPLLANISPHIVADPRPFGGSISRIYRDVRFSKDKSPYKTHVGIHFAHESGGGSEEHLPGFFLHLAPGDNLLASGVWRPGPVALKRIRDAIVRRGDAWSRLRKAGLRVEGEAYARVPPGYDVAHRFAADLKQKDFYTTRALRDSDVTARAFGTRFVRLCRSLDPLNRFLADALGVSW